ncbi:Glucosidase 2 subunit beta [Hypsizygus marmoreus]|uniref:Glucosidase 2 subunit beta n=1 Tax=Hypsizygus marmoreus TaxID=39966 RepID=A0A369JCF7_HYPMA|nr:Glucosidase 2 subunit beta [Hypsizygus marmoreus]
MIPWLLLLPLPLPVLASVDKTFGVSPDLVSRYVPLASGNWKCLDGSKEIPWSFVNDDSCDCPDGSDEPGTGACPNGKFYCQNKGHIGASIVSSRVNDGICEPECCDGSDEQPGVCKNVCKEGAKIRSTYIAFAHKEKKRLEDLVESTTQQIEVQEKEVARLKDIADRTESISKAAMEHKQQSPLYLSLIEHSEALKALQREHKKHLEREKALGDILNTLRSGYNPNYQDMAVLEAVRGWEELAGLPHIGEAEKQEESSETAGESEAESDKETPKEDETPEEVWTAEKLETDLDPLLNTDYVSLLLEHDEHIRTPHDEGSLLFDVTSYLPDSFIPQFEEFKDTLVSWLRTLGVIRGEGDSVSADSTRARQAFTDAERALQRLKDENKKAGEDLAEIFNIHGFGAEGEWKKLDGTCLRTDSGDYTYELCFFEEAKQIPKHGGTTFSLGRFESWNPSEDVKPGEPEYYKKQVYKHGTRCWNGPERNVVLLLTCGTENALLTVAELEKCEYQFTGTTPALCLPLNEKSARDEL